MYKPGQQSALNDAASRQCAGRDYIKAGSPRRANVDRLWRLCVSAGPVHLEPCLWTDMLPILRYHGAWREVEGYISA
jgi:hypothetical protein